MAECTCTTDVLYHEGVHFKRNDDGTSSCVRCGGLDSYRTCRLSLVEVLQRLKHVKDNGEPANILSYSIMGLQGWWTFPRGQVIKELRDRFEKLLERLIESETTQHEQIIH